ncbi:MAG: bifunctional nuclease domain-containing protein [Gemmatimonadales bacterium]
MTRGMGQDDRAIVDQVLAGDRDAFGILIDRHRDDATRLANRILRARADAEDVVQEALLHAFLDLAELRDRDRFVAWLLGIVVNLAKSRLRLRREVPVEDWSGGRAIRGFVWMDAEPTPDARQEARELHDIVWKALEGLPAEQQETVQLHYVDGLRVWEIAALVGVPAGTVKARLHRARGRLRRALAAELGVPLESGERREERLTMIPVTVDDLILRVPKDGDVRWIDIPERAPANVGPLRIVLLKEREGQRVLPIWVGAVEGNAIALALAGIGTPRPMSLSLMYRVLGMANIAIERVVVTALRDNIFYAVLTLRIDGQPQQVDARPSDAITLALYAGAPVFVTPEMLELPVVVNAPDALSALEVQNERARVEKGRPVEDPPMEWRSFRTLPDPRAAAR